jgi:hypothetical protein
MFKNLATKTAMFFHPWPNRVFALVILLFIAESGYVALTNSYPMAYDESYHFGIIQYYAGHVNPFATTQPADTYYLGNIVDNPSWLYHWLLSFPYRLLSLSGSHCMAVVGLRVLNIAMIVAGFFMLRRIVRQLGLPAWIGALATGLFALTPVVAQLSAQINYDNLMIFVVLLGTSLMVDLTAQAKGRGVRPKTLFASIAITCLGSLVKFSFLPIAAVFAGTILWSVWYSLRKGRGPTVRSFGRTLRSSSGLLLLLFMLGSVAVAGVYHGKNLIQYKTPVPDCSQVLSVSACSSWGPWGRNYTLEAAKAADPSILGLGIQPYTIQWVRVMTTQLFGNIAPDGSYSSANKTLGLIAGASIVVSFVVGAQTMRQLLWRYPHILLFIAMTTLYVAVLFYRNFTENLKYGTPVAVQGRYLVPLLGLVYISALAGVYIWFTKRQSRPGKLTAAFAAAAILFSFAALGGNEHYITTVLPHYKWNTPVASADTALFDTQVDEDSLFAAIQF